MPRFLAILALALTAGATTGQSFATESVLGVHDPYVRLAPPNAPATGAFMTIKNTGRVDRKLVKASSSAANTVELHTHINENGVMKMREVPSISIRAGSHTELKPGSYHVMLIGMHKPLAEGERIAITLSFDDGSTQAVDAPVRRTQTPMHGDKPMSHGGMKH